MLPVSISPRVRTAVVLLVLLLAGYGFGALLANLANAIGS